MGESCRERERAVQDVAGGVQGSIQAAGAGDVFRPQNEGPVLHHESPWHVLLILPVTRRIFPCGFVRTHQKKKKEDKKYPVKTVFRRFSNV